MIQNTMPAPQTNPGAFDKPQNPSSGEWNNGLFGCFSDCSTCLTSCCCPCVQYGHNKAHLDGGGCTGNCFIFALTTYCGLCWIFGMKARGELRAKYHINGGAASDCCSHFCCTCCALAQEGREIKSRGESQK